MKRLICLLVALGIVISTAGCVNPMLGLVGMMEDTKDGGISLLESIEKTIPPPSFLEPYFQSSQEVPLNNIPNADMENWTIKWDSGTFTGDGYYEGGSSLALSSGVTSTPITYTATSPVFKLEHNYISFYSRGYANSVVYMTWRPSYASSKIEIYDSNNNLLVSKSLASFAISNWYYGGNISGSGFDYSGYSYGVFSNTTGEFIGDDGGTWKRITVPLSTSLIGQDVKIKITHVSMSSSMVGIYVGGNSYIYVDDFYYSNSTGDPIYLLENPTAQFTYIVNGYDVSVDASISQTSGTLYSLKWTWGDGAYDEGVTASHTYAFPGNKQITLKIMNNENLVDTATLTVSVDGTSYYAGPQGSNTTNLPPIAGFSYGLTGMTIEVDGSYSKDDGTITLYSWDFDGVKKNGITASHTYANSGSKTVTLTVTDNYGLEGTRKITFDLPIGGVTSGTTVVDNPGIPPTAKFTYTLTAPTVTVDASGSSDDVKIEKYEWNWGDGSTSVGKTQTHTYSDMGTTRTITLTVTDNEGFTASSSATVQTISYNEPIDSNTTTYVAPPTTTGTSTPVSPSGNSQSFPVWGLIVFLVILGIITVVILGATGKVKLKGKGKRRKRK